MALFGFEINFTSGATDYAIVAALDWEHAAAILKGTGPDEYGIKSIVRVPAEDIVECRYGSVAVLSNVFNAGGGLT